MLDASAHNTANINTNGFKKHTVVLSEAQGGGVTAKVNKTTSAGPLYLDAYGNVFEASNADYGEEAVNQMIARHTLSANIAVFKTVDEMQKTLVDLFA